MDAFEICAFRLVSGLNQGLKASLHQGAYAAAQNRLFTEQIRFRLLTEGGLQNACSRAADSQRIGQSQVMCLSGGILLNSDQAGNTFACKIFAS